MPKYIKKHLIINTNYRSKKSKQLPIIRRDLREQNRLGGVGGRFFPNLGGGDFSELSFFQTCFLLYNLTWKYAIFSSNCALFPPIVSTFLADNQCVFLFFYRKRGKMLKITLIIGQKIRKRHR